MKIAEAHISDLEGDTPLYQFVPKDKAANLRYRASVINWGNASPANAQALWIACRRDLLYYINVFVWSFSPLYDPKQPKTPFISYPFQDEAFRKIRDAVGHHDLAVEKSRNMGASWMFLIVLDWYWRFYDMQTFLLGSRNENYVDQSGNPKALFWKLDFLEDHLPAFLRPHSRRLKLHKRNEENGSVLDGESATKEFARGDRRTAILLDEFASFEQADGYAVLSATQSATACRLFNSTPKGVNNAHYRVIQMDGVEKLRFHWSDHPLFNAGMYDSDGKDIRLIDTDYWEAMFEGRQRADSFNFIPDGKLRSAWYDGECNRTPVASIIAQELDIDYLGAGTQFYDAAEMRKLESRTRTPISVGDLEYDNETLKPLRFVPHKKAGKLKLWVQPDANGEFPTDRDYTIGADISSGTGASNSALFVADNKTGEQVAMMTTAHLRPEAFAKYAVAIAKWFSGTSGGALLIWEANGPGRNFGDRVLESGYPNIFYRKQDDEKISSKTTLIPGWWSTPKSKPSLLGDFGSSIMSGDFIVRDADTIQECNEYVYLDNATVGHSGSISAIDSSGAKDNHGDRVIAGAVCWHAMKSQRRRVDKKVDREIPVGSYMDRMMNRRKELKDRASGTWRVNKKLWGVPA